MRRSNVITRLQKEATMLDKVLELAFVASCSWLIAQRKLEHKDSPYALAYPFFVRHQAIPRSFSATAAAIPVFFVDPDGT